MKLIVDMNLSPRWTGLLADAGFEAAHWSTLGANNAPDSEIMAYASVVNHKYRNIKRRLFPHGGVARRCHRASYVASSRLATRKNPSVLFCSDIYDSRH